VLDFLLNVIKEHDKDLAEVVEKITSAAKALEEDGGLKGRFARIEEKLDRIKNDLTLLRSLTGTKK
jgi:hypothetical protein